MSKHLIRFNYLSIYLFFNVFVKYKFNVSGHYEDDWDAHPDHGYDKFFRNIQK